MLYLIDASVYVFRAYHSVDPGLTDARGEPANAVFGFGMFLCDLLERRRPAHVAAAFDASLKTSFRTRLYPAYKANRPPAPPELIRQFQRCRDLATALGVPAFASSRYEADDLIGSLASHCGAGRPRVYVTADKDLAQLLGPDDRLWDVARDRWLDRAGVQQTFGVAATQIAELLGLAGDGVDNIPGVPGVGRKTAAALLTRWPDLERIYADLEAVAAMPLRGAARIARLLAEHREQAFVSRQLATIDCGAPLACRLQDLRWRGGDPYALDDLALPPRLLYRARRLAAQGTEAV